MLGRASIEKLNFLADMLPKLEKCILLILYYFRIVNKNGGFKEFN